MNKSKIEWTDYTWNPITGCLHDCEYCYARKQSKRFTGDIRLNMADERCKRYGESNMFILDEPFISREGRAIAYPFGFVPTLHNYRMDWPQKVKLSANVFVGSMADVFGEFIPDEWIQNVFDACKAAAQHTYLFLTKNPKRYREIFRSPLDYRCNMYLGATVTDTDSFNEMGE